MGKRVVKSTNTELVSLIGHTDLLHLDAVASYYLYLEGDFENEIVEGIIYNGRIQLERLQTKSSI